MRVSPDWNRAQSTRILSGLKSAQFLAGAQKLLRVDRGVIDARLVVEMRPGRASGRSDQADHLACGDVFAGLHQNFRQMPIAGRNAVEMVDLDHVSITALPTGNCNFAAG